MCVHLHTIGYAARHVVDIGYTNTDDAIILDFAEQSGEVILTHDTDYGTLLALKNKSKPSVVLFRLEQMSVRSLFELLKDNISELEEELESGAIVVIEETGIRIRRLPIRR